MNKPKHGGNLAWAAAQINCSPSLIIDFSASINPWGPPQSAIDGIVANLDALVAYPDPNYQSLRQSLAQHHQLSPDWILPGNGSAELLTWASMELCKHDFTCLLTPAFGDYWRALHAFGAQVKTYPLKVNVPPEGQAQDHKNKFAQLPIIKPDPQKSLGLLLNNPHNPTGKLFSVEAIVPYLDKFALIVVDEAFMDFLPPNCQQSLINLVEDYPNLVILRSLTKFYSLPGLRLGYAIAHPERLQKWQKWRDPWPINTLAAAAGEAVLREQIFAQQTWDWLLSSRMELYQGLASLPGLQPFPSAANFLLVHTETSGTYLQAQLLQRHRILIRDCLSFPELGDNYFRVAVRSSADNQLLVEALRGITQG